MWYTPSELDCEKNRRRLGETRRTSFVLFFSLYCSSCVRSQQVYVPYLYVPLVAYALHVNSEHTYKNPAKLKFHMDRSEDWRWWIQSANTFTHDWKSNWNIIARIKEATHSNGLFGGCCFVCEIGFWLTYSATATIRSLLCAFMRDNIFRFAHLFISFQWFFSICAVSLPPGSRSVPPCAFFCAEIEWTRNRVQRTSSFSSLFRIHWRSQCTQLFSERYRHFKVLLERKQKSNTPNKKKCVLRVCLWISMRIRYTQKNEYRKQIASAAPTVLEQRARCGNVNCMEIMRESLLFQSNIIRFCGILQSASTWSFAILPPASSVPLSRSASPNIQFLFLQTKTKTKSEKCWWLMRWAWSHGAAHPHSAAIFCPFATKNISRAQIQHFIFFVLW